MKAFGSISCRLTNTNMIAGVRHTEIAAVAIIMSTRLCVETNQIIVFACQRVSFRPLHFRNFAGNLQDLQGFIAFAGRKKAPIHNGPIIVKKQKRKTNSIRRIRAETRATWMRKMVTFASHCPRRNFLWTPKDARVPARHSKRHPAIPFRQLVL